MNRMEERIISRYVEEEMKDSYLTYALSVIVGRALPDVRDGLKPVHRRILYTMYEDGLFHNRPFRKCATVVGDCIGRYHPHGDTAVYDALVRLAQDWNARYPLIVGQGNFGCFTKDTKIRLTDGRSIDFEELIEEYKQGKRNYTFTFNSRTRKIEISEIKNPRLTRKKAETLKVILDNGQEIKCTPDHPFMLRDGIYKKAKELQVNDSLMPLYTKIYNEEDFNLKGYEIIYQPLQNKWEFVHHLFDKMSLTKDRKEFLADSQKKQGYVKSISPELQQGRRIDSLPKEDLACSTEQRYNHKVKAVEFTDEREDVYDLTVEHWHNFSLAAGIFVHNSIDGDPAAAYRYTESRLSPLAEEMLKDIEKNTVDFSPNFDNSRREPLVLPSSLPNLLINGSSGIAVGMATNIPPHNLGEICDGIIYSIENPECSIKELMKIVKGPDFPTGGLICGREGIKEAYETGKGKLIIRAKAMIEREKRNSIVVTEIPYQVQKSTLIESIANLVEERKIEGISDIRDESDKEGLRIVVDLKRDAEPEIVLNQLYKHTNLELTFGVIFLALAEGRPRLLNLKQLINYYLEYRKQVIRRRTQFDLEKAQKRTHILEGLKICLKNLDRVIKIIKTSQNADIAKQTLIKEFDLSDEQAQAILEMQLQRLTGLEREKIDLEYLDLIKKIELYRSILASEKRIEGIIKEEILELKKRYSDERRTEIVSAIEEIEIEDLIPEEDVVITLSHSGYIKRLPVSSYRKQKRGGKGATAAELKEEDFVEHLFIASTKDYLLIFTDKGRVFWLKGYEVPIGSRTAKGKAIVNLLRFSPQEKISAVIPVKDFSKDKFLFMATRKGLTKKTDLFSFSRPRKAGIIGITLEKDDELIGVELTDGKQEILLATALGKAIRFSEKQVRDMGRQAKGVKGISLEKKDEVIGMKIVRKDAICLTVTENGFVKCTPLSQYRLQRRGGKGIINIKVTEKNGLAVGSECVSDKDELMVITEKGIFLRCAVKDIRVTGRSAQGVRLIRLEEKDRISSVAPVIVEEEEE